MSFKKKRTCSTFEHHEGAPPLGKVDEKPPFENGGIVLTNVVSKKKIKFVGGHKKCSH